MIFARGDWFFMLLTLIVAIFMVRPYVYAIQQDNYRIIEIFRSKQVRIAYSIDLVCVCVFLALWSGFYFLGSRIFWGFLTAMFFFIAEFALYFVEENPDKKKPLRYTKRAVRAMFAASLASVACVTVAMMAMNANCSDNYLRYLIFFAYPLIFPLIFTITVGIVNVFERLNNLRYERRARRTLASRPDILKIAITGSYGKTTVKNMLAAMLSERYNVLATPASYNTPMGIAKTIRKLDATHEVFIAEMGARRKGDIKKLMKIVRPCYSVLTGINSQHLETFGSQQNIIREKCRVVGMLEDNGEAAVTDKLSELPELTKLMHKRIIFAGASPDSPVSFSNVAICEDGSVFTLTIGGENYACSTPLLGVHNIQNLTLAAAAAYRLGISPEDIVAVIARLEPTDHRLQLVEGNGIRIIDDSFNGNPDGARCALEVLSLFAGRKIVVTPGLVELGAVEGEENYKLGCEMASVADVAMLVGVKRTEPIKRGLTESGFKGKVFVYSKLSEAEAAFKDILHIGDVLLILNDLPDIYDE